MLYFYQRTWYVMTGFMYYDTLQCVILSAFDLLLRTKHSIHSLFFKCSNLKKITFNLNNSIIDIKLLRCKKTKYFIKSIGLAYCTKQKTFIKDLCLQVIKELKLVTEKEQMRIKCHLAYQKFNLANQIQLCKIFTRLVQQIQPLTNRCH